MKSVIALLIAFIVLILEVLAVAGAIDATVFLYIISIILALCLVNLDIIFTIVMFTFRDEALGGETVRELRLRKKIKKQKEEAEERRNMFHSMYYYDGNGVYIWRTETGEQQREISKKLEKKVKREAKKRAKAEAGKWFDNITKGGDGRYF